MHCDRSINRKDTRNPIKRTTMFPFSIHTSQSFTSHAPNTLVSTLKLQTIQDQDFQTSCFENHNSSVFSRTFSSQRRIFLSIYRWGGFFRRKPHVERKHSLIFIFVDRNLSESYSCCWNFQIPIYSISLYRPINSKNLLIRFDSTERVKMMCLENRFSQNFTSHEYC